RARAYRVGVVPRAFAYAPALFLSVPQEQGNGIVGVAGLRPKGRLDCSSLEFDFEHVLRVRLMIVVIFQLIQIHLLSHSRADHGHVVPGDAGERLGSLLQPAIVDEPAVVDGGIGTEDDLNLITAWR